MKRVWMKKARLAAAQEIADARRGTITAEPQEAFLSGEERVQGSLFVPLALGPFERFRDGVKTVEVRQHGPRWNERAIYTGRGARLRCGYSGDTLLRTVGRVAVAPSVAALPLWAKEGAHLSDVQGGVRRGKPYFDPERPVIAFEALP